MRKSIINLRLSLIN